jgi:hypothetical protein
MTILEYALKYAEKNYSVIPISHDKRPLVKWEPHQKTRATSETIRGWWQKFPEAGVGIVTGALSNLLVVDTDTPEATQRIQEAIPESLVIPCETTPRGGMHFFFSHKPGFSNRAKVADGIDIRTEGGYIAVAPSLNGNGKGWVWVESLLDADPPDIDLALNVKDILSNSLSLSFSLHGHVTSPEKPDSHNISQVSQRVTDFFGENLKDEHLFHTALCLQRGGCEPDFARHVLNLLVNSWGENIPSWVESKVKSAWDRALKRERNISQEVKIWVEMMRETSQSGLVTVTDWAKESQVSQKRDLHAGRMAFKRLCDPPAPILERYGDKAGQYRILNLEDNEQKWWEDEGRPLSLVMPLGIERYAKVFPGNIILLEGQKSQGKSTFAIEFARLNHVLYPGKVIYQNVEMPDSEIKERFKHYENRKIIKMDEWRNFLKFTKRTSDWADKIEPDSINIVDYLVEYEKAYILPKFIFDIHKKLNKGIALCIVQRDPFKPYPTGGRAVRDIPRLIISIINHSLRLEDVKTFYESEFGNPSGISIKYKQVDYCEWKADGKWERKEEEKYGYFEKKAPKKNYYEKED